MELKTETDITPCFVKQQLDEILAREIAAFVDLGVSAETLSFNLTTISCMIVIVAREREIKQYADFPPERYVLDSFVDELVDIGLERDPDLETAITSSVTKGYITRNQKGELKAEMPAFLMAGLLETIFPGMQGLNLIAFILQMNEEVNSGRKSLELAQQSFEAALKTRGVSVSRDHAEKRASDMASGVEQVPVQTREISGKLKQENLERLSRLMKMRKKRSEGSGATLRVTDLFDKGPSKEALAARKIQIEQAGEAARQVQELAGQLAEKDERIRQAQEVARQAARQAAKRVKELEEREEALKAAQEKAEQTREKAEALGAREALLAEKESQLRAMEVQIREKQAQVHQELEARAQQVQEQETTERPSRDEDVDARIAALESKLSISCPLCTAGEIQEKTTEKGKKFFTCSQKECRFVSWEKPHHFECPLCKNLFLIEMQTKEGGAGLKCPRAGCSFTQKSLLDPRLALGGDGLTVKKKRKVVRRIKRR